MPTTNLYCNHDSRVAQSGGTNLGSGASDGLPFGLYGTYRYRTLLAFPFNFTGWTAINSAYLYVRTSSQIHVGFGGSPTVRVQRMNVGGFTEGTSDGLSGSNAVVFPGPAGTTVNQVASGLGTTESTWRAINVTAMMRDALAGNPIYGLLLTAWDGSGESNSASHVGEIYSRDSGNAAYISFDYATNTPPNAPTVSSTDVSGGLCGTQTPTVVANLTDPQTDALTEYTWQLATDSAFSFVVQSNTVAGSFPNGSNRNITFTSLVRGTTYYFRIQAKDASVYGAWSSTFSFKVASLPTVTVSEPSGAGRLGHLWYVAGSGWVSPRLEVDWALTCPDGGSQYSYRVEVQADSAGSPSGNYTNGNDSTTLVDSSTTQRIVPITLTEGAYYHVQVTATCSHGLSQTVTWRRIRVRWAVVTHQFNMGAPTGSLALTILDVTDETTGGAGRAVVEYMTGSTTAAPSAWSGTIGGAGLLQYLNYRAWLLAWGASPAVSPSLNEIKVTYTTATITPDKWQMVDPANASGDVSAYVYGTKSLRLKGKGSTHWASQPIPVAPNTYYILSGRVQSVGNSGAYIDLATADAGTQLVLTPPKTASVGFESPDSRVVSVPWFSGSNTQVYVRCIVTGAVGTTGWFDAIKVEASSVVTPWTPGYVANAVVLDAGGLQIDAFNGGIFRLRAGGGGVRDTVDLDAGGSGHGLVFGGDTDLYSPLANVLGTSDQVWVGSPQTPGNSGVALSPGGNIELNANASTPFIDFKNDATHDFDARIIMLSPGLLDVYNGLKVNGGIQSTGQNYFLARGGRYSGTTTTAASVTPAKMDLANTLGGESAFLVAASDRLVIPSGADGLYLFTLMWNIQVLLTGTTAVGCNFYKNGALVGADRYIQAVASNFSGGDRSIVLPMSGGDYIEIFEHCGSGVTAGTVLVTDLSATRIGQAWG